MEDSTVEKKKGAPKGLIAIIVGIIVLAGGAAAAFMMINSSPKASYFQAEKNTIDFVKEHLEERFEPELSWYEKTMEDKTSSNITLTANYQDPNGGTGFMDPSMFINNSSITLLAESDMKNNEVFASLNANIAGMEIEDIEIFADEKKAILALPFLEDAIQLNDEDFGPLMAQFDPALYTGDETLGLKSLFESTQTLYAEEDLEYLEEEYVKYIYEQLPEDAFKSVDEKVEVDGTSLNAEKITLQLTEKQLKDMITNVLTKMEKDEKLKEIIVTQLKAQQFGGLYTEEELDITIEEFETVLADMKTGVEDLQFPEGLTSTIWIDDKKVVQRDFHIEMGVDEELVTFAVKGSQLFKDTDQHFNYDFSFKDDYSEGTMNITGDMTWKDGKGEDSITLTVDDTALSYEGSETLKDGKRDFERTFSFKDSYDEGSLNWNGFFEFSKDEVSGEHNLSLNTADITSDMISLKIASEGKVIDKVQKIDVSSVKNLGEMTPEEIGVFIDTELTPRFEEWLYGNMGGGFGF